MKIELGSGPRQRPRLDSPPAMNQNTVLLDVRDDIRSGREPFSRIMNAVAALRSGQQLLLLAPFEPVPMVHMLKNQGFRHTARATDTGDWEVLFVRDRAAEGNPPASTGAPPPAGVTPLPTASVSLEVDARGLEPPMPMVKILEALATLPGAAELRARTDRRPIHLYAQLEERGFSARTEEQPDGSFVTSITRR